MQPDPFRSPQKGKEWIPIVDPNKHYHPSELYELSEWYLACQECEIYRNDDPDGTKERRKSDKSIKYNPQLYSLECTGSRELSKLCSFCIKCIITRAATTNNKVKIIAVNLDHGKCETKGKTRPNLSFKLLLKLPGLLEYVANPNHKLNDIRSHCELRTNPRVSISISTASALRKHIKNMVNC